MYRIAKGDSATKFLELHRKYGPLLRIAPNEVSVSDPAAIPHIYRHQNPLIKSDFYAAWSSGNAISNQPDLFSAVDEKWHAHLRRILNPVYALSNIIKNEQHIQNCTSMFVQKVRGFAERKELMNIGDWAQMYTFDVIGELMFGEPFGFLEKEEDYGNLISSLDAALPVLSVSAVAPAYYRPALMAASAFSPAVRRAVKATQTVREASLDCVTKRKREIAKGSANRYDLLQQLMDIVRDKGEKMNFSDKEVSLQAWQNMFAGSDTTAIEIRASFYYLSRHPEWQRRVQEELDAACDSISTPIKYTETMRLPITCACIKEAMRLFPSVVTGFQRLAPKEGVDLLGKHIPEGYRMSMTPAVVHHHVETFGTDSDEYKPERWLVSEAQTKAMEKAILTFGGGTRGCAGKNIAQVEIFTVVPETLRYFNVEWPHKEDWKTSNHSFRKAEGLIFRITERKSV
ncbi:cytochrome P450 [Sporormia fimetaria CBS 119925]|uniref:Cytochrome P450 n=1 Tax=Sporormia fimetaria CBS 119925 TaxID=1340428 RepID=A0A6A6VCN6_9PLEO|nr:cytochrome P450 [Sporormia fimetaria CBS 119925]